MGYKLIPRIWVLMALATMLALYLFVVGSVLVIDENGFKVASFHAWGDTALHLGMISVMSETNPFWAEHPVVAGIPLTYPFAINFFSAMLQRVGVSDFVAFQIPMFLFAGLLFFALWLLGKYFLKRDALAVIFVAIVLFGGGLGFFQFFLDLAAGAPFSHEYTRFHPSVSINPSEIDALNDIVWIVPAISFFSHQRAFILGAALGALMLWGILRRRWEWLMLAGLLPIVHTHTFLAFAMILPVFVVAEFLRVWRGRMLRPATRRPGEAARSLLGSLVPPSATHPARSPAHARPEHAPAPSFGLRGFLEALTQRFPWLVWGTVAVLIALPQVIFLMSGKTDGGFFEWWPGWMAKGYENVIWFWTNNFGVVFWGWVIVLGIWFAGSRSIFRNRMSARSLFGRAQRALASGAPHPTDSASLAPTAVGAPSSLGLRSFLKTPRAPASDTQHAPSSSFFSGRYFCLAKLLDFPRTLRTLCESRRRGVLQFPLVGNFHLNFTFESRAALRAGRDAGQNTNSEENRMRKRGSPTERSEGARFPEGFRAIFKRICSAGVIGRAESGKGLEITPAIQPPSSKFQAPSPFLRSEIRNSLMIASIVLFVVSHLVKFQPWEFDNGKVLLWWWVLAAMIILSAIGDLIAVRRKLGILLLAVFVFFGTFAGFLDVVGRMAHLPERLHGYYGKEEALAAEWIRANTAPREAFLTAGDPADFVPILAGRPLYLGFTGWLWSHGRGALVEERRAVISEFLITGDPRILCESGVGYFIWDLQFESAYPMADRATLAQVLEPVFTQEERTIYQLRCD